MMNEALLRAVSEFWGTGLQFDPLPGEYDLNYMVSGAHDGVLKIINAGRDRAYRFAGGHVGSSAR